MAAARGNSAYLVVQRGSGIYYRRTLEGTFFPFHGIFNSARCNFTGLGRRRGKQPFKWDFEDAAIESFKTLSNSFFSAKSIQFGDLKRE